MGVIMNYMNQPPRQHRKVFDKAGITVWNETAQGGTPETALYIGGTRTSAGRGHNDHHIIRKAKQLAAEAEQLGDRR